MLTRIGINVWHLGRRDDAQDLLEYALLASLIAIAVTGAVSTYGIALRDVFWNVIATLL